MATIDLRSASPYAFGVESLPVGMHTSDGYQILLAREAGTVFCRDDLHRVSAADMIISAPYEAISVTGAPLTVSVWRFTVSDLFGVPGSIPSASLVSGVYPAAGQTDDVRSLVSRALTREGADSEQDRLLTRMMLSELVLHLASCAPAPHGGGKLAAAAAYLSTHFREDISLDTLCEQVGISKFYFCRAFHGATGLTPHAYLTLCRVLEAERLLRRGVGAMQCGEQVGYTEYTTFYRSYKKMLGRAPSVLATEDRS